MFGSVNFEGRGVQAVLTNNFKQYISIFDCFHNSMSTINRGCSDVTERLLSLK